MVAARKRLERRTQRAAWEERDEVVTAIVTALLAVMVFVLTQSFLKPVLEPIQEQRRLIEHHSEYLHEASKAIHDLAGRLEASLWTIPFYDKLASYTPVPKRADVRGAARELRGWSKGLEGSDAGVRSDRLREAIAQKLGIEQIV
jgi:hypothetical protein